MVLALMRWRKLKEEDEERLKLLRLEGREEGLKEGREKGREEGREEGLKEGCEEERRRWEDWWERHAEELRRAGLPYDDPPPSEQNGIGPDP